MTDNDKELVKVLTDAAFYGTGFMKDGKHIPLEDVYLDPRDALIKAQAAEIERLREALRLSNEAHWFYLGDDCSSDQCRFSIDECIDEDFEWDNPPMGDHVLQISGARPVPDMWVALHYFSEEEKDERDDDEPYSYTVHATEEEARAALGETE